MAEDAIEKDTRQIASTLQLPKADVDHCRVLANPAVHPDLATIFGSCEGAGVYAPAQTRPRQPPGRSGTGRHGATDSPRHRGPGARGRRRVSRACVPHLRRATNPHILTPVAADQPRAALAQPARRLHGRQVRHEPVRARVRGGVRGAGIASNALWPRTLIATAAVQNALGGDEPMAVSRKPAPYADAADAVIARPSRDCTGTTFMCEDALAQEGVTEFDAYAYVPRATPQVDMLRPRLTKRSNSSCCAAVLAVMRLPHRCGVSCA